MDCGIRRKADLTTRARLIVPLTFMEKGTLKGFDMTDGSGQPAPVVGRSEHSDLLVETLMLEINTTGATRPNQEVPLREALAVIVDGDPDRAQVVAEELVDLGSHGGVACLEPTDLSSYAADLLHKLAVWYILIALVPWDEGGRRVVLKYSHHSRQDFVRPSWRVRLQISAGWDSLDVGFDLSYLSVVTSNLYI